MGFDAIWISPVTLQVPGDVEGSSAYHGYWQQDLYQIEPHFGTAEELNQLSQELHSRDMVNLLISPHLNLSMGLANHNVVLNGRRRGQP